LIQGIGWRGTLHLFSAMFFVMMFVATCLVGNPPSGYRIKIGLGAAGNGTFSTVSSEVPTSSMVRMADFWILWLAYCLGATAGLMVISQLVPFVRASGHGAAIAAAALMIASIGNTTGRIFSGWMSDHLGRLRTLCTSLLVLAIAMPVLFLSRGYTVALYAALAVVYYCYGTQLSVYPATSAEYYGTQHIGLNYGILILAWGIAGIAGPLIAGRSYVAFGDYRAAFLIAGGLSLAASLLLFIRKPQKPFCVSVAVSTKGQCPASSSSCS
jgi:MFS transporter, OFA family, oxalate/formate antiporter